MGTAAEDGAEADLAAAVDLADSVGAVPGAAARVEAGERLKLMRESM